MKRALTSVARAVACHGRTSLLLLVGGVYLRQLTLDALLARLQRERGAKIGMQHHVEEIARHRCVLDSEQRLGWRPTVTAGPVAAGAPKL